MLTAHLPSGYVLGRAAGWRGSVLAAAVVGAVTPDLDMIRFHLLDHGQVHHHRYWTHIPAVWLAIGVASLALPPAFRRLAAAFLGGVALHLILDSIGGDILWGWPVTDRFFSLVTVPARHGHWIANYLLHWTFMFELLIWGAALFLFVRHRTAPKTSAF